MPSQAVRAAVPHFGAMASAAARAAVAGLAGLPDAARAVVGMATAAAVRASAARPRRAARVVGFMSAPRVRVFRWPPGRGNDQTRQLRRPNGRNGWDCSYLPELLRPPARRPLLAVGA